MKRIERNQGWDKNGNLLWDEEVERELPVFEISKLALRRLMRKLGLEAKLNVLISQSDELKADWQDAAYLMSDDPVLLSMIPAAATELGKTEEEIYWILDSAKV